jgi:hypothetical protein
VLCYVRACVRVRVRVRALCDHCAPQVDERLEREEMLAAAAMQQQQLALGSHNFWRAVFVDTLLVARS